MWFHRGDDGLLAFIFCFAHVDCNIKTASDCSFNQTFQDNCAHFHSLLKFTPDSSLHERGGKRMQLG